MVIDGVPIRVAAHVKTWTPRARAVLGKGTAKAKETEAIAQQWAKLCPISQHPASCTHCRQEYSTRKDDEPPCYRDHLVEMAQQEAPSYSVAAE